MKIIIAIIGLLLLLLLGMLIYLIHMERSILKSANQKEIADAIHENTDENKLIRELITSNQKNQTDSLVSISNSISDSLRKMQVELLKNDSENQLQMQKTIRESLNDIRESNTQKLQEIQKNVDEKLDRSLNERLDSSFKQIGEQLSNLHKSLGELNTLSSGVTDLQKTLSNVKTRGIFGEMQLKNILANVMDSSQYDENVITKAKSSDRVEFAIKIPDKDDSRTFIHLPIDSKFPADIYNKIIDASEAGDSTAVKIAVKELEQRIKLEARTIRDKYIDPPNTTDFAIMFLPTEGLYAEVLRINGLTEWCQNECKIVVTGPTTVVALLNSLSIGFRYLTVNKSSKEILKTLSAVKAQYEKFGALIEKTQKKLSEAQSAADELQNRSQMIQKKLVKVDTIDGEESNKLLGITTTLADEEL